ncbi:MAG TPA: cytochrome c [Thermodesulfobacteriota bacterium]|nr:cytochrome c [Thermodesulfobacteriota bacterium]
MRKIILTFIVTLVCLSYSAFLVSCSQDGEEAGQKRQEQVSEETEPLEQAPASVKQGAGGKPAGMKETGHTAEGMNKGTTANGDIKGNDAQEEGTQVAEAAQKGDPAKGKETYNQICASCHGPGGKGDGPAAAALDPKPRDHTDVKYMSSISNDYMFKVISQGGASVGKSQLMPAWGGTLSEQDIWNVIAYIRQDLCKCQYTGK